MTQLADVVGGDHRVAGIADARVSFWDRGAAAVPRSRLISSRGAVVQATTIFPSDSMKPIKDHPPVAQHDPLVVISSLGGPFTEGGTTVTVSIVRLQDTPWSLEVIAADSTSTTWDELFATDVEAKEAFLRAVVSEGLHAIVAQ